MWSCIQKSNKRKIRNIVTTIPPPSKNVRFIEKTSSGLNRWLFFRRLKRLKEVLKNLLWDFD